jgi:hypothetical protein
MSLTPSFGWALLVLSLLLICFHINQVLREQILCNSCDLIPSFIKQYPVLLTLPLIGDEIGPKMGWFSSPKTLILLDNQKLNLIILHPFEMEIGRGFLVFKQLQCHIFMWFPYLCFVNSNTSLLFKIRNGTNYIQIYGYTKEFST